MSDNFFLFPPDWFPSCFRKVALAALHRPSEACHEFHDNLVLLRWPRHVVVAVEVFLEVEAYVADERFLQTQRHTTRQSRTLVVVDGELSVGVAGAVAVV